MRQLMFFGSLVLSLMASATHAQQPRPSIQPQRAALGVTMSDNTPGGVLIMSVLPGSPAARIGLRTGDRILSIGGKPVSKYSDVVNLISAHQPNTLVDMRVNRGGWTNSFMVRLGSAGQVLAAKPATVVAQPTQVRPGSLAIPDYAPELTPADIDDQHGYGG